MNLNKLKEQLAREGWIVYPEPEHFQHGVSWYACYPLEDCMRLCASNCKRVQLVLKPYRAKTGNTTWESCEIDLTAAYPEPDWFKLCAYGLNPEQAARQWREIGMRLQRAWEVL